MKQKTFWKKSGDENPFNIPGEIRQKIADSSAVAGHFGDTEAIEYLWIHITTKSASQKTCGCLAEQEWLNIIDEAASIGARWLVMYVGAELDIASPAWTLTEWAQSTHEMCVAYHYTGASLSDEQVQALNASESGRTFLFVEESVVDSLNVIEALNVPVLSAAVPDDIRGSRCTSPASITCVQSDGTLYCCGLVMDEDKYNLGDARDRAMADVRKDSSLPQAIENADNYPTHGCEGCPSHLSKIILANLPPENVG